MTHQTAGSDDTDLWGRARAGDSAAFAQVYDLHRDAVLERAREGALSDREAEDVLALVFLEAWRRRARVRTADGWLLAATDRVTQRFDRVARRHRAALSRIPRPLAVAERRSDPDRLDDVRALLVDSVEWSLIGRPARRAVAFASLATVAVLLVGGVGVTISRISDAPTPGQGAIVAPTDAPTGG